MNGIDSTYYDNFKSKNKIVKANADLAEIKFRYKTN